MAQKVVINRRVGGFSVSRKCVALMVEHGYKLSDMDRLIFSGEIFDSEAEQEEAAELYCTDIDRNESALVKAVEELGPELAGGYGAYLKVVEIPDGIKWYIQEKHGVEQIAEDHRVWK